MKKKPIIIIFLLLLFVVSLYLAFFKEQNNHIDETSIQLGDTTNLTEILFQKDSTSIYLVKKGNSWMVNNSFHANKQLVKKTLRIFKNINIKTIVKRDSVKTFASNLTKQGTNVKFIGKSRTLQNYWVGDFDENNKACLIMNDQEIPIFANAPGFTSDISEYISTNPLFWRDKRLFDFEPNEFISIILTDYKNKDNSFQINSTPEQFELLNLQNHKLDHNRENIERYLSYFKNISFDSLANKKMVSYDTLMKKNPIFEFQIKFINEGHLNLKLFEKPNPEKSNDIDLNKAYGLINDAPPIVVISYFSIDPLLKSIDYFKSEKPGK